MMQQDQIFTLKLLDKLFKELKSNDCVVPTIKINDTVKQKLKIQLLI